LPADPELLLVPEEEPDLTVPDEFLEPWPDDLTEVFPEPEEDLPVAELTSVLDLTVDLTASEVCLLDDSPYP
jgi:hypothetical protein